MTILRILKKFCFGRAPRARITACMGRKCYLHGLLDDRTAILDAWHVLSCPVRHARALPACPELFASLFVCISFWVGSLRETLLRVLEVLGMSRVRSLKMMPRHHFGNFGAERRQPAIFGPRGTRGTRTCHPHTERPIPAGLAPRSPLGSQSGRVRSGAV